MTIPNQWYYVKNNERCGPVEPAQLKQLADAGEIQRDCLVWRVGMANWVEAEQVQGLFPQPVQPGTPSITEPQDIAARPASPARQSQPQQPPVATPTPMSEPLEEDETPLEEEIGEMIQPEPMRRARIREKGYTNFHPTAMLLDWLRPLASRSYVGASVRLFTQIGYWSVFAYVLILLVGNLIAAVKAEMYDLFGIAVGVGVAFIVLQYVSVKMIDLLGAWKFESRVPRAVFDMLAILALLSGVGSLVFLTYLGLTLKMYTLLLTAVASFIVLAHFAKVALSLPTWEAGPRGKTDRSIADEATAVFGGLLLVTLRTVPVVFGTGIALASLQLLYEMGKLGKSYFFSTFTATSGTTLTYVAYCLLLPLAAYLASVLLRILGKLVIVVIRGSSKP